MFYVFKRLLYKVDGLILYGGVRGGVFLGGWRGNRMCEGFNG